MVIYGELHLVATIIFQMQIYISKQNSNTLQLFS